MTKQTIIPAGYRLSITSWENDGDHYQTKVLAGLTPGRVRFIIELCKLFRSHHSVKSGYGNLYDPSQTVVSAAVVAVMQVMQKHRNVLTDDELDMLGTSDDIDEVVQDYVTEFIGKSEEDFTFRVFEKAAVESIPAAICIDDVSAEFGV